MIGIGDYDAKSRNTRKVITREGQRLFNGKKYAVERDTGYMVCTSGSRKRLHVAMWEAEHGEVPDGYIVHHIDWDKTHNEISNFALVSFREHNLIHNPPPLDKMTNEEKEIYKNLKIRGLIK